MTLAIIIISGLVGIICFLGGANILLKGAGYFLPKETPPQIVLDNVVRFMAGIYLAMGFLCIWTAIHANEVREQVYLLGIIVCFSGLGRLYSRIKVGAGGTYLFAVMCLEIILGIALILLQYFR